MKIYLDDVRMPYDNTWVLVKNIGEFMSLFDDANIDPITMMSFDHDLGMENGIMLKTGFDAAKWLINVAQDDPTLVEQLETIIVHSSNPPGAANIRGIFKGAQRFGIISENVEIR